jgi:hypothetical protein
MQWRKILEIVMGFVDTLELYIFVYAVQDTYLHVRGGAVTIEKARTTKAMYYRMFPTCSPSRLEWGKK